MTPRLCLRKVERGDLETLVNWSRDPASHGVYLTPDHMDAGMVAHGIESGAFWNHENKIFMVERKPDTALGTIHCWRRSERKNCAVVAVKIARPEERNKGYGTEAQKYLIINLFERHKVERVEMYTDINNMAQQRCLKKLGFELVESLTYDDHGIRRVGHLFRLDSARYARTSIYQYHYEA